MKRSLHYLILVVVCLIITSCQRSQPDSTEPTPLRALSNETLPTDVEISFSGDFLVTGYPTVEKIHGAFCEDSNCPSHDYVYFNVSSSEGTPPPSNKIGLGCRENGIINYSTDSDEFGIQEKKLNTELSNSILSATKSSPVSVRLIKLPVSLTRILGSCSSEFTSIEAASS